MASSALIQQLLQQDFAKKNQPSGLDAQLPRILQIMQGVASGIQIYDGLKSLPGKFGTPATMTTTPGVPGVPQGIACGAPFPA